jgi:hypothetical protein
MAREFHQKIFDEISVVKGAFDSKSTSSSRVGAFVSRMGQVVGEEDADLGRGAVRVGVITAVFFEKSLAVQWSEFLKLSIDFEINRSLKVFAKNVTGVKIKNISDTHDFGDLDAKAVKVKPIIVIAKKVKHRRFERGESKSGFEFNPDFHGAISLGAFDNLEHARAIIVGLGWHALKIDWSIVGERDKGHVVAMGAFDFAQKRRSGSTEMTTVITSRSGGWGLVLKLDDEALEGLGASGSCNSHETGGEIIESGALGGCPSAGGVVGRSRHGR